MTQRNESNTSGYGVTVLVVSADFATDAVSPDDPVGKTLTSLTCYMDGPSVMLGQRFKDLNDQKQKRNSYVMDGNTVTDAD